MLGSQDLKWMDERVYLMPSQGDDPFVFDGIAFVHKGPLSGAIIRFTVARLLYSCIVKFKYPQLMPLECVTLRECVICVSQYLHECVYSADILSDSLSYDNLHNQSSSSINLSSDCPYTVKEMLDVCIDQ